MIFAGAVRFSFVLLFHSSLSLDLNADRRKNNAPLLNNLRTSFPPFAQSYSSESDDASIALVEVGRKFKRATNNDELQLTSSQPLLRKCCALDEELSAEGCVKSGALPFHPVVYHNITSVYDESTPLSEIFTLVFGDTCMYGKYRLEPAIYSDDEFYLLDNGSLILPAVPAVLSAQNFCMEAFLNEEDSDEYDMNVIVLPLVCFPQAVEDESEDEIALILYPTGQLLSVPFLLFVLFAHIFIPELHGSLHGRCFMCHVISLSVAYLGLSSIQLSRSRMPTDLCMSIAFIVQFSFIACFSWLNVMCYDIWRRIRNASSAGVPVDDLVKARRKKRFIFYSMYAWSCPAIIILVSMVMDLIPSIPAFYLKPQFGVSSCWFLTDDAALPYFYGPISLMIFANMGLFIMTAKIVICDNKKQKINLNSKDGSHTDAIWRQNENIKSCFTLFILMGLNWTMEIISWAVGNGGGKIPKQVWYFTDMCNTLQGIFIFIIFIKNSTVRYLIKRKFHSWGCYKLCGSASYVAPSSQDYSSNISPTLATEDNSS